MLTKAYDWSGKKFKNTLTDTFGGIYDLMNNLIFLREGIYFQLSAPGPHLLIYPFQS